MLKNNKNIGKRYKKYKYTIKDLERLFNRSSYTLVRWENQGRYSRDNIESIAKLYAMIKHKTSYKLID